MLNWNNVNHQCLCCVFFWLSSWPLSELERLSGLVGRPSESHPLHNSGLLSLDPVQDKTPLYSQLLQAYKWSNKVTTHHTHAVVARRVPQPMLCEHKWGKAFWYIERSDLLFVIFTPSDVVELQSHSSVLSMSMIWLLIHWQVYCVSDLIFSFWSDDGDDDDDDFCLYQ